jgi:hypothetical protein
VEDLSADAYEEVAAPAPSAPAEELPTVELEPELAEIELVEEAVEPPPPPPPPRVPPAPVATARPTPPAPQPPSARASLGRAAFALDDVPVARPAPVAVVPGSFVEGEHRVIIHTVEGQVKRGTIRDMDLLDDVISLEQQTGFAPERIPGKRVKAIFFMLPTGARQPQAEGQKVRVTFNDGRQVAGFSRDYKGSGQGFFMIPADNRTNTARIFIYRSSVQAVAEG